MDIFYTGRPFSAGHITVVCSQAGVERIFLGTTPDNPPTALCQKYFPGAAILDAQHASSAPVWCAQAAAELQQYAAGTRQHVTTPLVLRGTPFQQQVWQIVQTIPYGSTVTYGEIADRLGENKLSRAVGLANGANNYI